MQQAFRTKSEAVRVVRSLLGIILQLGVIPLFHDLLFVTLPAPLSFPVRHYQEPARRYHVRSALSPHMPVLIAQTSVCYPVKALLQIEKGKGLSRVRALRELGQR